MDGAARAAKARELSEMRVDGTPTTVGWDSQCPVNETVDKNGNALRGTPLPGGGSRYKEGFGFDDPHAPARRAYDDPTVTALRDRLRAHNGLKGLDICNPGELDRIFRVFHRDGFVVVRDVLTPEQTARWQDGCARVLREILSADGVRGQKYPNETGRLPHRYSYGTASASRHMCHDPDWAAIINLESHVPILSKLFGSDEYVLSGCGGDLAIPGAVEMQQLHSDGFDAGELSPARIEAAAKLGVKIKERPRDLRTFTAAIQRTPPSISLNFVMSPLTWENGPIRQIPGTHLLSCATRPPTPQEEPEWMKYCTLVGAQPGACVFRDHRCWHSGTPNVSKEVRTLPNIEVVAPWAWKGPDGKVKPDFQMQKSMPHEVFEALSPHAQRMCRFVKCDPGVKPAGAGVLHAHGGRRYEANKQRGSRL